MLNENLLTLRKYRSSRSSEGKTYIWRCHSGGKRTNRDSKKSKRDF